jgi:hypothetical protein
VRGEVVHDAPEPGAGFDVRIVDAFWELWSGVLLLMLSRGAKGGKERARVLTTETASVRNSWFSKRPRQPFNAMQFRICITASEWATGGSSVPPIQPLTEGSSVRRDNEATIALDQQCASIIGNNSLVKRCTYLAQGDDVYSTERLRRLRRGTVGQGTPEALQRIDICRQHPSRRLCEIQSRK